MIHKIGSCRLPFFVKVLDCTTKQEKWTNTPLYTYIIEVENHRLTERFYHDIYLQHGFQGIKTI